MANPGYISNPFWLPLRSVWQKANSVSWPPSLSSWQHYGS